MTPILVWLHEATCTEEARVGPKAARLARMAQAGLPVPAAFALTTHAFALGLTDPVESALLAAYHEMVGDESLPVAVRSSAVAEDLAGASFAGMQETVLNVRGEEPLRAAVRHVWASVESPEARAYRAHAGLGDSAMAVLIQRQVAARVAGVAFARDPLTGEACAVIEAVPGLGEGLVSGQVEPQRWRVGPRHKGRPDILLAPNQPLLTEAQVAEVLVLLEQAGRLFGGPQDVEWAWDGEQLWMLQARPITTPGADWFTDLLPDDPFLWSAGFLNERFTEPVSPLGWTLVATHLERLALRDTLDMLGGNDLEGPLLKLWQGHPYTRTEAWQRLYKLFPAPLLSEDAERYFPEGDSSLRHAPAQPRFTLALVGRALGELRRDLSSPLLNPRAWERYERRQTAALLRFRFAERQLARDPDPIPAARALLQEASTLTSDLLELHRWSLLYADVSYGLLRRLLALRYGPEEGSVRAVRLTTDIESPTTRMNRALEALAHTIAEQPVVARFVEQSAAHPTPEPLATLRPPTPAAPLGPFLAELERFLDAYGHRFFSLDFYDAPWEADWPALARFLLTLAQRPPAPPPPAAPPPSNPLLTLTRAYLRLREAQRFHWQQLLALQRRVVMQMGGWWVEQGQLSRAEELFGLTWGELMAGPPDAPRAAARLSRLHQLRAEARQAPGWHYPEFLRGTRPLHVPAPGRELAGRAVSPGLARGPARLIAHPSDFARLRPGDILVTTSPDPGWTPIFGTVGGMVTERGGQLSHGAVVAREYRLPAVSGIPGLLAMLQDGEPLLVDGTRGVVIREALGER